MPDMRKKLRALLKVGDIVYSSNNGVPMQIKKIDDEGFYTEQDFFFFDEVRKLFYLTKIGYERRNDQWT